ncbi:helix-turn-helix transcriptional regulator [Nocardia yunnanensis]|uniref:Helix-turn-helix transcriptional regulator n=1 Tax=Nocardia yunnanensis TaxID=2382165 RepID=A0A386ZJ63_9NOCA|nr:LuxR family transcriptional regulator [Nocardia yunnanensis]AYF77892.1 helix-turn-helix transcriptional regulator [Nocardia yunnanensis]
MLCGRELEQRRLSTLLSLARTGQSAALGIIAEPGTGKTALLDRAVELADGSFRILRCAGVEDESELPFAGLLELLLAAVGGDLDALPLDALPQPQSDALRAAIGSLVVAGPVDRFLVGLATLSLLAELADGRSVLCTIDDVQWLDRASSEALRFAARRLGAEGIVMLFASRVEDALPGITKLHVSPLDGPASDQLLADRWPGLGRDLRERILREASGNPLALLELPRMDLDALPVGPLPLPYRLASGYRQQIAGQSDASQTVLLAAAAESAGDLRLVLRVLDALGVDPDRITEAEASGLIDVTAQAIRFRHPLVRAAVYHGASFLERQAVHTALAAASADDPDRRAWHLAAATVGQDEQTAALLESAAVRAVDRSGYSAASAAMERAALLTPDREIRSRRLILATEWAADAGRYHRAEQLARQAEQLPLGPDGRARLGWVQAKIEFDKGNLRKARDSLLSAADAVAAVEPERAGPLFIAAARASWIMGDPVSVVAARTKLAALQLPPEHLAPLLVAIDGALKLHSGDLTEGVAVVRAHIAVGHRAQDPELVLAAVNQANLIGDLEDARTLAQGLMDSAQNQGMIGFFTTVVVSVAAAELMLGRVREAEDLAAQAARIARDIGQHNAIASSEGYLALIAAIRGDEQRCRDLIERNRRAVGQDNFIDYTHAEWALSLLDLGYGRYEAALDRLDTLHRIPGRIRGHWLHLLRDLVEAAVRAHQPERAAVAVAEIERWSAALGSPFAEAIALRSRAMLDSDGDAYARALKLQAAEGLWYDHARTALLYGEWLRRERSAGEARTQLRHAVEIFDRLGAAPWAAHARTELRAAGEGGARTEVPTVKASATLTPQELQVVRLAAAGATNKEIATKLFLSPKTVGHHLYRAFPKLGVANRVELARLTSF